MLSPNATWTAQAEKVNGRPVYLVSQEYDYLKAQATTSADFQAGSGADATTKLGSVICNNSVADIMTESSYGTTTRSTSSRTGNKYYVYGILISVKKRTKLYSLTFTCKSNTGASVALYPSFRSCSNNLRVVNPTKDFSIDTDELSSPAGGFWTITTSYADYTCYIDDFLEAGDYVLLLSHAWPNTGDVIQFKTWEPNTEVINYGHGFRGWDSYAIQVMDFYTIFNKSGEYPHISIVQGLATDFSFTSGSFDGQTILKEFNVYTYTSPTTYTSAWIGVKDSSGSLTTPTTNGQVRLDYVKPANTAITFVLWWATDSAGTGATSLGAVVDGDTVSTLKDYYRIVATMTTTDWFSTPEINSLSCYFKKTNDYCKFDDSFIMASGLPARPYVAEIPSYETTIDPISNRVSFNQPTIDYIIQRKGMSNAQSDIEALAQTYFLTGKELSISIGWDGVSSDYFINYQTGVTDNQVWMNDSTLRIECKDPYFTTKDPYLFDSSTTFRPYFNYEHPSDIMLSLISSAGFPQRLIDSASFASMKTATGANNLYGWEFYRPYTEEIKDIKKELDELCLLTGWVPVTLENGKIYAKNLLSSDTAISHTFTDQNSKEVGKANIDLSKRVNVCSVRRGFWIEPSDQESKDVQYWETAFDDQSVSKVGRGEILKIDNKWVPKDSVGSVGSTDLLAKIIANRIVDTFKYGLWTLKRSTSLAYSYLQLGDQVNVTGSQILYKNFYGENTVRGVIIGKKVNPSARNNEGEIEFTIWLYQNLYGALASRPAGYPTALVFANVDTDSMDVSWTVNADANPAGHIVLRRAGYPPESQPESGVTYAVNDPIGDATVEFVDAYTTLTFNDASLSSDTEYHYAVYPYNGSGATINYATATPLRNSKYTNATEPGAQPTTFVFGAFSSEATCTVKWTDSVTAPLAENHLILRKAGGAASGTPPTDLTGYSVGDTLGTATVVYIGSVAGATGFTDTNIAFDGTTYHYAAYPFRGSDATSYNYLTAATVLIGNKATSTSTPTAHASDFSYEEYPLGTITLTWTAASPTVTGYLITRIQATGTTDVPADLDTYVDTNPVPDAGVSICKYAGSGTSTTDATVTGGSIYTYTIFTYNGGAGAEKYLTVGAPTITLTTA